MPIIRPFRGLRYHAPTVGRLADVVAPPYDIIYDGWRDRLYDRHPNNVIRLIKTKDAPGEGEAADKYRRARDYIDSWMREGVLVREPSPAIYVMADTFEVDGREMRRFGFVSLVRIEEFGKKIYPHERTLSGPKVDRLHLVKETEANLSQIFSIFNDPDRVVQGILHDVAATRPEVEFVDEQDIYRRMWLLTDPVALARLQEFMKERTVIIADGHHRYETALAYREFMEPHRTGDDEPFDFVSMYFSAVDAPGMAILPTHRKVGDLDGFDPGAMYCKLGGRYAVEQVPNLTLPELLARISQDADTTNVFGVLTWGGCAVIRREHPASPKDLDVEVLHTDIIEETLGLTRDDIAAGRHLHFSKSPEHAWDDVISGKDQIAFFMNPVTPAEMFRVVTQGRRLPQKSTYFYPKTLSGLVMYKIDRESLG